MLKVDATADLSLTFEVFTTHGGFNDGKIYAFRVESVQEREEWIGAIRAEMEREKQRKHELEHQTLFSKAQHIASHVFQHPIVQMSSAALVMINFLVNVVQFELLPEPGTSEQSAFDRWW